MNMTDELRESINSSLFYNERFGKKVEYVVISDLFLDKKSEHDLLLEIVKVENRDALARHILDKAILRLGENLEFIDGCPARFRNEKGWELGFYDYTEGVITL